MYSGAWLLQNVFGCFDLNGQRADHGWKLRVKADQGWWLRADVVLVRRSFGGWRLRNWIQRLDGIEKLLWQIRRMV